MSTSTLNCPEQHMTRVALRRLRQDPRVRGFIEDARGGDELAVHSLWAEFGFNFDREGGRDDLD